MGRLSEWDVSSGLIFLGPYGRDVRATPAARLSLLASLALLVVLQTTSASALQPVSSGGFTTRAPYLHSFGATAVTVDSATGSAGGNTNQTWSNDSAWRGAVFENLTSYTTGLGMERFSITSYAGLDNISFQCTYPCGYVNDPVVTVTWNISWDAFLATSCGANSPGEVAASLVVSANLTSYSNPAGEIGRGATVLFHQFVPSSGSLVRSGTHQLVKVSFRSRVLSHHDYFIDTSVEIHTSAQGSGCSSYSTFQVGGGKTARPVGVHVA